jgi:hypothetical protein
MKIAFLLDPGSNHSGLVAKAAGSFVFPVQRLYLNGAQ